MLQCIPLNAIAQSSNLLSQRIIDFLEPLNFNRLFSDLVPLLFWFFKLGRGTKFGQLPNCLIFKVPINVELQHGMRFERDKPVGLDGHVCNQSRGNQSPVEFIASVACFFTSG